MLRLIILAPPGGGKGTQATLISKTYKIPHISTGDMLRDEIKRGSALGRAAERYVSNGQLVPDELILKMIKERLGAEDCNNGYILDGFPRTDAQAKLLKEIMEDFYVLYLDVPDEVIVERLSSRRVCPKCGEIYNLKSKKPLRDELCDRCGVGLQHRDDDRPETVRYRLKVYHTETEPLIQKYRDEGKLIRIDCSSNDISAIFSQIKKHLDALLM